MVSRSPAPLEPEQHTSQIQESDTKADENEGGQDAEVAKFAVDVSYSPIPVDKSHEHTLDADNMDTTAPVETDAELAMTGHGSDVEGSLDGSASTISISFRRPTNPIALGRWKFVARKMREGCFQPGGLARYCLVLWTL